MILGEPRNREVSKRSIFILGLGLGTLAQCLPCSAQLLRLCGYILVHHSYWWHTGNKPQDTDHFRKIPHSSYFTIAEVCGITLILKVHQIYSLSSSALRFYLLKFPFLSLLVENILIGVSCFPFHFVLSLLSLPYRHQMSTTELRIYHPSSQDC